MTRRSAARRRRPQGRSRLRGLLKWSGTLACLLIFLVAARSWFWRQSVRGDSGDSAVILCDTCVGVLWGDWVRHAGRLRANPLWLHYGGERGGDGYLFIPLWIPFVLIGLPTAWLWWRDRRRVAAGGCAACGYDLTGNVSGRCLECGEESHKVTR